LDEFVPDDHEVRIINDVVDAMDLSLLLDKYEGGGAPAYHPVMMLKVIVYAYSLGIYSSRRIAQELKTDTAFMFLSGLQSPDFRTICLFRTQHADVLPDLFVEVVRLCASLGMIGLGHIAIDGTKLRRVNITDPESRLMQDSRRLIQPSYNGQIAVDHKEQVIVAAAISQNTTDHHEFRPMLEQVEQNLGVLPKESSADSGYSSYENLEYAEQKGVDAYMPDNFLEVLDKKEESEKRYHKSNFRYEELRDVYICPEGRNLRPLQQMKRQGKPPLVIYRGESCKGCALKRECTRGPARRISRDRREGLLEMMREKLRSKQGKEIYKKRAYTVEPVMGHMKWNRRKLMMSLRGLEKVRGEFYLMCLAHNVKKIVKGVLEGTVNLSDWYSGLARMATLGYRQERLILVKAEV